MGRGEIVPHSESHVRPRAYIATTHPPTQQRTAHGTTAHGTARDHARSTAAERPGAAVTGAAATPRASSPLRRLRGLAPSGRAEASRPGSGGRSSRARRARCVASPCAWLRRARANEGGDRLDARPLGGLAGGLRPRCLLPFRWASARRFLSRYPLRGRRGLVPRPGCAAGLRPVRRPACCPSLWRASRGVGRSCWPATKDTRTDGVSLDSSKEADFSHDTFRSRTAGKVAGGAGRSC